MGIKEKLLEMSERACAENALYVAGVWKGALESMLAVSSRQEGECISELLSIVNESVTEILKGMQ